MCSGRNTLGKSTTFGRGKRGIEGGSIRQSPITNHKSLMNGLGLSVHVVHEDVLAKRVRRREVRLAAADRRDAPDERDEVRIAREHERVDHDAGLLAGVHLGEGLGYDERVEADGMLVDLDVESG